MHRFQLNRITPFNHLKKSYALNNGVYSGGSSTREDEKNDIICISPFVSGKHFQLLVANDNVYLSTAASLIEINFDTCPLPSINHPILNGDLIGIGCPTTQECFYNPDCYIFQLIQLGTTMDTSSLTSEANIQKKKFPCNHPPSINDYRRAAHPIKCPYRNCSFTCWTMVSLNEHVLTTPEHRTTRADDPNFALEYSSK